MCILCKAAILLLARLTLRQSCGMRHPLHHRAASSQCTMTSTQVVALRISL